MTSKEYLILAIVIAGSMAFGIWAMTPHSSLLGGGVNGGSLADACTASSTVAVPIGSLNSLTILAPYANRAYARIQQPINATNTVTINLNSTAAVVGNGVQLTAASSTNPVPFIEVGLNTSNPYTGAITAITNTGSTTVLVSTCNY